MHVQTVRHLVEGLTVILLHPHIEQKIEFLQIMPFVFPGLDDILQLAVLLVYPLGKGCVVPEVGGKGLTLQTLQILFLVIYVKDAPSGPVNDP